MEIKIIEKKISLEPKFIDNKFLDNILNQLKIVTKNDCSEKYGYILSVSKIVKITEQYISPSNSHAKVKVLFEAKVLHPQKGKIYKGKVCMIFSSGIFVNINDIFKTLIPTSELTNYIYDSSENCFKKDKEKIKVEDELKFSIIDLEYSKNKYSCYGKLI